MPAKRFKLVGLAGTLEAMRRWLKVKADVPVVFQTTRRRRTAAVVVRLERVGN